MIDSKGFVWRSCFRRQVWETSLRTFQSEIESDCFGFEREKKSTEIGKIGSPAICQNICSFPILKKSRTFKEISDCLRQSRNKANRKMNEYIWSSFIRMTLMLWIEQNVDVSTLHSSCKGGQHSKSYLWIWIGILMLRDVVKKQTEVIWWNFENETIQKGLYHACPYLIPEVKQQGREEDI